MDELAAEGAPKVLAAALAARLAVDCVDNLPGCYIIYISEGYVQVQSPLRLRSFGERSRPADAHMLVPRWRKP